MVNFYDEALVALRDALNRTPEEERVLAKLQHHLLGALDMSARVDFTEQDLEIMRYRVVEKIAGKKESAAERDGSKLVEMETQNEVVGEPKCLKIEGEGRVDSEGIAAASAILRGPEGGNLFGTRWRI